MRSGAVLRPSYDYVGGVAGYGKVMHPTYQMGASGYTMSSIALNYTGPNSKAPYVLTFSSAVSPSSYNAAIPYGMSDLATGYPLRCLAS